MPLLVAIRERSAVSQRRRPRVLAAAAGALLAAPLFALVATTPAAAETPTTVTGLAPVTQDVSTLSAFDAEMLRLTNVERAKAGVPALQEARGLTQLSAYWSGQLAGGATGGKLQHNPRGLEMTLDYGAKNRKYWGENVLKWTPSTATAAQIFQAYFDSPTHRDNILNAKFNYLGASTVTDAKGTSWNTMNFTDKVETGQTYNPKAAATPIGHFESLTVSGTAVTVKGWALDPDIKTAASKVTIKDTAADGSVSTTSSTANANRPELAVSYPASGSKHGFSAALTAGKPGKHTVCVTVINQGGGLGDVDLGCLSYSVATPAPAQTSPLGSFDSMTRTATTVTVSGWAVDPAEPTQTNTVIATVTNAKDSQQTKINANRTYATDVAGAGRKHGFTATLPLSAEGSNKVCLVSVSRSNSALTTDLGCKEVTVDWLAGNQESATVSTDAKGVRTLTVQGWALDHGNPTVSANVRITVTAANGMSVVHSVRADGIRTDIGRAFPGAGDRHGYAASGAVALPGAYQICSAVISTRDAGVDDLLGCTTVIVK